MKISDQVKYILQHNTDARNSDRELLLAYMSIEDMGLTERQKDIFRHMPSTETIRRIRQKFQEQGQFPATTRIKTERSFMAHSTQQRMPSTAPEKVETLTEPKKFIQKAIPWL